MSACFADFETEFRWFLKSRRVVSLCFCPPIHSPHPFYQSNFFKTQGHMVPLAMTLQEHHVALCGSYPPVTHPMWSHSCSLCFLVFQSCTRSSSSVRFVPVPVTETFVSCGLLLAWLACSHPLCLRWKRSSLATVWNCHHHCLGSCHSPSVPPPLPPQWVICRLINVGLLQLLGGRRISCMCVALAVFYFESYR